MRRFFVLVLPLLLSGCVLPPIVGAVAYLADGVSYLGTGKSVSDHALSAVMDEDCATWRLLKGELICQGPGDKGRKNIFAVAAATTTYPGEAPDDTARPATTMLAEAPRAAEPAASRLAAIEPAAGPAHGWPVAADAPRPIERLPTLAADKKADSAMLHLKKNLLKFRAPAELVAKHPCPGSGRTVFCSLSAARFNG
jgi:hypothetical protein